MALMLFFSSSLILSQSLVELAQKEKERRAKIKEKKSIVITNSDLTRLKKSPAVAVPEAPLPKEKVKSFKSSVKKTSSTKPKLSKQEETDKMEFYTSASELKEKLRQTREYCQLLILKINALWQEFYNLDDTVSKESLQKRIEEAKLRLKIARKEGERIKQELSQLQLQAKK